LIQSQRCYTFSFSLLFPSELPLESQGISISSDEIILLTGLTLLEMKQTILAHQLDILIYGEIGMDLSTYLLAFSRLAPISLVFWGHAITSGVLDYESIASIPLASSSNSSGSALISRAHRGGPDYFISSILFENHLLPSLQQQQRYSERLILQEGLTTYFEKPELPFTLTPSAAAFSPESAAESDSSPVMSKADRLDYIVSFLSVNTREHPHHETFQQTFENIQKILPNPERIHLYGVPQVLISPHSASILTPQLSSLLFLTTDSLQTFSGHVRLHEKGPPKRPEWPPLRSSRIRLTSRNTRQTTIPKQLASLQCLSANPLSQTNDGHSFLLIALLLIFLLRGKSSSQSAPYSTL
jgi:hypothetical protein